MDLVYGDTDSLYMSYDGLLNTIEGVETMTLEEKRDIIARINQEFLDKFNEKLMDDYYASRHVESCHKFELETIAKAGIWLDVKKRYARSSFGKTVISSTPVTSPSKPREWRSSRPAIPRLPERCSRRSLQPHRHLRKRYE